MSGSPTSIPASATPARRASPRSRPWSSDRRARIYALPADAICARSAIAWGSMDIADLSGAGVRIVHALVPGGRPAAGLDGRNPLGIVDGVEQRVEAARQHQSRREQLHVLCRAWVAGPQYGPGGPSRPPPFGESAPARR